MKITAINTFVMGVRGRNWTFVKIETDEGIHGWGEATLEWHEPAVVAGISLMSPLLIGQDPTRIEWIWEVLFRHHWWRQNVSMNSAMSGIDQALWDIAGKAYGQPVYRLLGGAYHERVRLYARPDLGLNSITKEAEAAVREGYTAFKIGGMTGSPFDEKREVCQLIRECDELEREFGSGFDLMLDLQGVFSYNAILKLVSGLKEHNILWIEEPVSALTLDDMKRLIQANLGIPFTLGERLCTRWGFKQVLEEKAADIIQPDVCHAGGISELKRLGAYAEIFGIPIAPHNPLGPVAMAASVHAAATMPNFLTLEHCRSTPLFHEVQQEGIEIRNGVAELPERPGLGIELDEKLIAQHPYHPMPLRTWNRTSGAIPMI